MFLYSYSITCIHVINRKWEHYTDRVLTREFGQKIKDILDDFSKPNVFRLCQHK